MFFFFTNIFLTGLFDSIYTYPRMLFSIIILFTNDIAVIDWGKNYGLIELVLLFLQIVISTILTIRIIILTNLNSEKDAKYKEYELKIMTFDKRIEVYGLCNFILRILEIHLSNNNVDFEIFFRNCISNVSTYVITDAEKGKHQLSSEYMSKYDKIMSADIVFDKELISPFIDAYKETLNLVLDYYHKKFEEIILVEAAKDRLSKLSCLVDEMKSKIALLKKEVSLSEQ